MEFLNQLGSVTEQRWKARNYDDDHFAEIAFQTLQELPPSEHVTYEQIIEWALRAQKMPAQNDFPFGQPPIVLFRSSHFYIEALFWLEGTTSIHQHAFSGAFHVLGGSSIHSNFDFQLKERINARFLIGDIVRKHTEFLSRGDTRRIQPGSQFIHSLFHLDEPSVTIVIRTTANIEFQPQYTYLIPSIAIDPFVEDLTLKRRLQLLTVVQKANHLDLFRLTSELLSNSDIETAFRILEHCYASWDEKEFMKLFEKTRSQHGSVIDYFSPVLEKISRASYLVERRKSTQNPDHRFFFALLLDLPDREDIFRFIRARYDKEPRDQIVQWVRELSRLKVKGDGNALGIRFDEISLRVLRCMLDVGSFEALKKRLKEYYPPREVDSQENDLRKLYSALLRSVPFKPLFDRRLSAR